MTVEAEIGVLLSQTKECQEPAEAGRGMEGSSPDAFRGSWPCQHLDFRLVASRSVKEYTFVVLSNLVMVIGSPKKTNTSIL